MRAPWIGWGAAVPVIAVGLMLADALRADSLAVVEVVAAYEFPPTDDRLMADFASDIFVGRVVARAGGVPGRTSSPRHVRPRSQFTVEVLEVVKGSASGMVVVNQESGIDPGTNRLHLMRGDRLLRPGETALFITKRSTREDWYHLTANQYSHLTICTASERAALVGRFARVVGPPTPPDRPSAMPTPGG